MGELFENFKDFDFPAAKKKAIEEGLAAGRAEGLAAGREEGLAAGREEGLAAGRAEGLAVGREAGIRNGIKALIALCHEFHLPKEEIVRQVAEKFEMDEGLAAEYYEKLGSDL